MAREPDAPENESNDETPVKEAASAKRGATSARTKKIVTGAAIGIGSAALVAALLYANRTRNKQDKSS